MSTDLAPRSTSVVAPLSLDEPIDKSSPSWPDAAKRLQGNILTPHGRTYSALLPFRIGDISSRRELGEFALRWITSAEEQERRAEKRKSKKRDEPDNKDVDVKLFGFLYLSAAGYRKLRYGDALERAFADPLGEVDNWFVSGLPKKQSDLGFPDSTPGDIEDEYKDGIDALLVLACDNADVLRGAVEDATAGLSASGNLLGIEHGEVQRNHFKQSVEPFGFADSITRPQVFKDGSDPLFPRNLLLNDPLAGGDPHAFGSYLVYCKLEQDKIAFDLAVNALAHNVQIRVDQAEALIIGRFKDGTPLTASNHPLGPSKAQPDFTKDLAGAQCPFQAHIRKVNPRVDSQGNPMVNPLFRRGVPYKITDRNTNDSAANSRVGLLFLAFQADIARQFGSILLSWVNSTTFPVDGTGTDALMGNIHGPQKWPVGPKVVPYSIGRFVKFRGGEFLFAPSLPFFESLLVS